LVDRWQRLVEEGRAFLETGSAGALVPAAIGPRAALSPRRDADAVVVQVYLGEREQSVALILVDDTGRVEPVWGPTEAMGEREFRLEIQPAVRSTLWLLRGQLPTQWSELREGLDRLLVDPKVEVDALRILEEELPL
ncbi:MAG TPA: hypothetical protein PLA94_17540, partial [Myxococcota bacterium]|nr:hypothetical protein [Myxococcota bacterium]